MSPLASWPHRTGVGSRIFWLAFRGLSGMSCVTSASLFWFVFTSSYVWNKALSKECECTFSTVFLSSFHVYMLMHVYVCRGTCTYVCTDACGEGTCLYGGQRSASDVVPRAAVCLWSQRLTIQLCWLANEPQTSACLCLSSTGPYFTQVLGIELKSWHLQDKHSSYWTPSPVFLVLSLCKHST